MVWSYYLWQTRPKTWPANSNSITCSSRKKHFTAQSDRWHEMRHAFKSKFTWSENQIKIVADRRQSLVDATLLQNGPFLQSGNSDFESCKCFNLNWGLKSKRNITDYFSQVCCYGSGICKTLCPLQNPYWICVLLALLGIFCGPPAQNTTTNLILSFDSLNSFRLLNKFMSFSPLLIIHVIHSFVRLRDYTYKRGSCRSYQLGQPLLTFRQTRVQGSFLSASPANTVTVGFTH